MINDVSTPSAMPKAVLYALASMALGLSLAVVRSVLMRDWSHPSSAIVPVVVLTALCLAWLYGLWRRRNWLRWTTIVLGALGCLGARWSLAILHDPVQVDLYWVQFATTLLTVVLLLLPSSRNWYVARVFPNNRFERSRE
jgi:type IV secretory pathway VirB2 component (pilin)